MTRMEHSPGVPAGSHGSTGQAAAQQRADLHDGVPPTRYRLLRRKIVALLLGVAVAPLCVLTVINYQIYQTIVAKEFEAPLRALVSKTKNSFELFFAERTSAVSFIASAYPVEKLSDDKALADIFEVMRQKFSGFVDMGFIDERGRQVSYVGPYDLKGKDYADQPWFREAALHGSYITDVFTGLRKFPHIAIVVRQLGNDGKWWTLRATVDTRQYERLIAAMGISPDSDAFLLNKHGILQTDSTYYGALLQPIPFPMPRTSYETQVVDFKTTDGQAALMAYVYIPDSEYVLMAIKPKGAAFSTKGLFRADLAILLVASVLLILLVAYKLTGDLVARLKQSDERRELAFRHVEHSQKLSSIGRLAAGVAHEINNPLAIINEKAGLMKDLLALEPEFPKKDRFIKQIDAIAAAVARCRNITHRMLGFARQMDVNIESIQVNDVLKETASFLERESAYRNIELSLSLTEGLPAIESDRGQLQQVFLNMLNNAFAAVNDGGAIAVATWRQDDDTVGISIKDNGCGMSEEVQRHVFEPFFTTKKGTGTGLGLSISYGIIKRLGGDIALTSKPNLGTTFTILLPVAHGQGGVQS
ncbi:MAG: two-component sensor histidine kinase [Desulfovibrio sp.]|nr:two-component sensor histidine kinase [Desulfovibrio sp.]MCA1984909.1 two-component sensor histidine kinase [Desulfovibrio sp.]